MSDFPTRNLPSTALTPYFGHVPDRCLVDRQQAELFAAIGQTQGPFRQVAAWPRLEDKLSEASALYLDRLGDEAWRAAGGEYDAEGRPYCAPDGQIAKTIVTTIVRNTGGLLWRDPQGQHWAVRLSRMPQWHPTDLYGFAIGWDGGAAPSGIDRAASGEAPTGSRIAAQPKPEILLFRRAEQLLCAIHAAVLAYRRSVLRLPDAMLGQILWGAEKPRWPQDWRGEIFRQLVSLSRLRAEILRLGAEGWRPRLGAHSVLLAHVEQLGLTRPQEDVCRPDCPMFESGRRHGHFLIQVGMGFLGVLEQFFTAGEGTAAREYDFQRLPGEATRDTSIRKHRKAGGIVSLHLPTSLFGPSRWAGLAPAQRRIIQALSGEVTRSKGSPRPDHGDVVVGNVVPGVRPGTTSVCPFLGPEGRYVAFGGNKRRRGLGYRIVGKNHGGWLAKCGYGPQDGERHVVPVVRRFLRDLRQVARLMGLIVVAIDPRTGNWHDLEQAIALAATRRGWKQLDRCHLRVYGGEDYLDRLRAHFEHQGGFAAIPGAAPGEVASSQPAGPLAEPCAPLPLAARIRRIGWTQEQLARRLGKSAPFINRVLNAQKPWPAGLLQRAEALITAAEVGTPEEEDSLGTAG